MAELQPDKGTTIGWNAGMPGTEAAMVTGLRSAALPQ